jgi:hypothetical protein
MSTPKPTRKATIAVFGGSGDYSFLQNYKLFFKHCREANVQFSVESEQTEHGLTVNYAKYEYIEEKHTLQGIQYGTHFIFIEFATWDDAMKAMWDGFSLEFMSIIFATQRKDPGGEYIFGHVEQILEAAQTHGHGEHTAWIVSKDLDAAHDVEMGEEEYRHIKSHFRTDRFHFISAPPIEKWNQTKDIWKSKWHSALYHYRTTIPTVEPDINLDAESRWKFEKAGTGTYFRAEIYGLPEDEGGAPITAGGSPNVHRWSK